MSVLGVKEMTRTELERYKLYCEIAALEIKILANAREMHVLKMIRRDPDRILLVTENELLLTEMKNKTEEYLLIK